MGVIVNAAKDITQFNTNTNFTFIPQTNKSKLWLSDRLKHNNGSRNLNICFEQQGIMHELKDSGVGIAQGDLLKPSFNKGLITSCFMCNQFTHSFKFSNHITNHYIC